MRKVLIGVLSLLMSLQLTIPAMASPSFIATEEGTVSIKNPMTDDVYTAGGTVVVNKPVQGDLIVAGGTIEINASVSGDVLVAGGTVMIRGSVGDDIRMMGGQVNVYGVVGDDVLVAGGTVLIGKDAVVKGDLLVATGDFTLEGRVLGNVKADSGVASVKGSVVGNADIKVSDSLSFATGAKVGGTLNYWAPTESAEFSKNASQVQYHKLMVKDWNKGDLWKGLAGISIAMLFWKWLAIVILGGLLLVLLPKYLSKTAQHIKAKFWETVWHGLLLLVVIPALGLLAVVTLIGAPIALVLFLIYGLLLIFGGVSGAYFIGRMLLKKDGTPMHQFGALALGALIFVAVGMVPIVGGLARLVIMLIGLGGIYREKLKLAETYR